MSDSLVHNIINISSCWSSSFVQWIKTAVDQVFTASQVRAVSVQLQIGKDLPANTVHPPDVGRSQNPAIWKSTCCTDRNKLVYTWKSFHGLCSAAKTCCFVIFALIIEITWYQCFSSSIVFLETNHHKGIIPIYELFFQVEAVKYEVSSYSFYAGVRIPIAKMAFLPICEITFI